LRKLVNLGCKLNQYEGYCLLEKFSEIENLVIINTCCVTKTAETKSEKKFHQALRQFPGAEIIVSGCACSIHPDRYRQASQVIDNADRNKIIMDIKPKPTKARYFLKIQDGCDLSCSYCIVPKVRARVQSKSLHDINEEISWARSLGYKEVVLVGANIGLYGQDLGLGLEDMLATIVTQSELPRIRLSSLEPFFISHKLIQTLKALPICHHFHIPIQSADDSILNKMKRDYDVAYLSQAVESLHDNFADVAIGADVIVGFPGEGETEFLNTYRFLAARPFTHVHVFPYSPRPGTQAYDLGDPIPSSVKNDRLWELKKLIKQKNYEFRCTLLNKKYGAIIEHIHDEFFGLTDNYIRAKLDQPCAPNELIDIIVTDVSPEHTHASVCSQRPGCF